MHTESQDEEFPLLQGHSSLEFLRLHPKHTSFQVLFLPGEVAHPHTQGGITAHHLLLHLVVVFLPLQGHNKVEKALFWERKVSALLDEPHNRHANLQMSSHP